MRKAKKHDTFVLVEDNWAGERVQQIAVVAETEIEEEEDGDDKHSSGFAMEALGRD
jgi:hypothetical protein